MKMLLKEVIIRLTKINSLLFNIYIKKPTTGQNNAYVPVLIESIYPMFEGYIKRVFSRYKAYVGFNIVTAVIGIKIIQKLSIILLSVIASK